MRQACRLGTSHFALLAVVVGAFCYYVWKPLSYAGAVSTITAQKSKAHAVSDPARHREEDARRDGHRSSDDGESSQADRGSTAPKGSSTGKGKRPVVVDRLRVLDITSSTEASSFDADVSRTVLAIGVPQLLPGRFQPPRFSVFYLEETELVLPSAFERGCPGLLLDGAAKLPFADFAFDIVVVGGLWCPENCEARGRADDILRVLRPLGKLILWPKADFPELRQHPLVQSGSFSNVFVRSDQHAKQLPICPQCMPLCRDCSGEHAPFVQPEARCQAYVASEYVPVDAPSRRAALSTGGSVSSLRISRMHLDNAEHVNYAKQTTWLAHYRKCCGHFLTHNYLGKEEGGKWLPPHKNEWLSEYTDWIRSGKVKRLLDAGAGTCTLDAIFRLTGVAELLQIHAAFGYYDCSMARICAERGSVIFEHDWLKPMPLCAECRFDMIFQAEGIHHSEDTAVVLDNFDAVLLCGGRIVLQDQRGHVAEGSLPWDTKALHWAKRKKYDIPVKPETRGGQYRIVIIKRCPTHSGKGGQRPSAEVMPNEPDSMAVSSETAPPAADAPSSLRSVDTASMTLPIDQTDMDVAQLDAPTSRTVLALGVTQLLPSNFKPSRFSVFYIEDKELMLAQAFEHGCPGLTLSGSSKLPFVDFAFDVVVVGSLWCEAGCDGQMRADDILRVLRPSGKLVLWPGLRADDLRKHPLVRRGSFSNVMIRLERHAPDVAICPQCLPLCRDCSGESIALVQPQGRCQAYVMPEYVSVDAPSRRSGLLSGGSVSQARISQMRLENAEFVNHANQTTWLTHYRKCCGHFLISNYLGKMQDGKYSPPRKNEWLPEYTDWIRSGKVTRLLDAGAGTCTLDAIFRATGLSKHLQVYAAFGYYDCSMARICAERGSVIFEHDWMKPLPMCAGCMFDMVFQAEGIHHSEETSVVLDNFGAVLECGGRIVLQDQRGDVEEGKLPWDQKALQWATAKNYEVLVGPESSSKGKQWRIIIVKRCSEQEEQQRVRPSKSAAQPEQSLLSVFKVASQSAEVSAIDVPVSRTVLAVGVPKLLAPSFHSSRYAVIYVEEQELVARDAFEKGSTGLLLDSSVSQRLPFVDLSFDIVVLGPKWYGDDSQDVWRIDEVMRLLRPLGKLVVWPGMSLPEHPLAQQWHYANVFVRPEHHVEGVPVCRQCQPVCKVKCWAKDEPSDALAARCQPFVAPKYASIDSPARRKAILASKSVSEGRIANMRLDNANTVHAASHKTWLKAYEECCSKSLVSNYLGHPHHGSWLPPAKIEWLPEYTEWIKSGKVKRLLDAGAGACTLDTVFRLTGVSKHLKVFSAFGFYDCSMARVCAERGSIIVDHDWIKPLPFCPGCHYDMVFQAEGMHHSPDTETVLNNFDAVLTCGGRMVLQDLRGDGDATDPWDMRALRWAKSKGYDVPVGPEPTKGKQWRIIIIKRC